MAKLISYVSSEAVSDHGGQIVGGEPKAKVNGKVIAVEGISQHVCPQLYPGGAPHGTTPITAVVRKTRINGRRVITTEAFAGCGAKITVGEPRARINE